MTLIVTIFCSTTTIGPAAVPEDAPVESALDPLTPDETPLPLTPPLMPKSPPGGRMRVGRPPGEVIWEELPKFELPILPAPLLGLPREKPFRLPGSS